MAFLSKREDLAQKVDTAAVEAERLGLTTATLTLQVARLEIDRAEPDEVESMPGTTRPASQADRLEGSIDGNSQLIAEYDSRCCVAPRTSSRRQ
jgi:hypothetical protein